MKGLWKKFVVGMQICALAATAVFAQSAPMQVQAAQEIAEVSVGRKILNFNSDWGFYRGDLEGAQAVDYNDEAFANVTIPHTMRLEKKHCNGGNGSYKGIGWYRRYFTLGEEYRGKKINIDFEGVMIDSEVYLNGELVAVRNGGYVGFSVDISDKVNFGETNVLAVRVSTVDNPDTPPGKPETSLDFHYYGGIYRDVTLRVTEPLYISDALQAEKEGSGGVFVTYPQVTEEQATVQVKTHVVNEQEQNAHAEVEQVLKDQEGRTVASVKSQAQEISANSDSEFTQELVIEQPKLWHPDHPNLYDLETKVYQDGELTDSVTTRVGIRTIAYKSDGLYINGERLYLRGANRHQAFLSVGDAGSNSMQYRDALILKENGFNAVRAAHYPQDPAFLAACDELGLLVIECQPGWQNFTNTQTFYDRTIRDTREMIRRDRNHPSVVLWETSLNETRASEEWVDDALAAARQEYPGNQFFAASDYGFYGEKYDVCYKVQDTQWSQDQEDWVDFDPDKPFFTREWGDFEDSSKALRREGTQKQNEQVRTRERYLNGDGYSDWGGLDASDRIGGYFLWSFNDYTRGSNSKTLGSGTVDIDRYEKNCYYWLQSMQSAKDPVYGPMVYISDDYTEDSDGSIMVFSNCDSVKLYQDGNLVDEIFREDALKSVPNIAKKGGSPIFTFQLEEVKKGTLKAEAILDGQVAATHEVRTPETAVRLEVEIGDRGVTPVADGSDLFAVYVKAVDENGTIVPDYEGEVHLAVTGEGELVGKDIPRIKIEDQILENGVGSALVRTSGNAGDIVITASAEGLEDGTGSVTSKACTDTFVPEGEHTEWIGGAEKLEEEQLDNLAERKPVTASSQQTGNEAANGVDEDDSTRWCASGGEFPQWYQIDLEQAYALSGFQILWENAGAVCKYVIQVSKDGETWENIVDLSENETVNGSIDTQMVQTEGRYVRIQITGVSDGWASFYEFRVFEDTERGEIDPGDTIPDEMVASLTATGGEVEGRGTDKLRDGVTGIGTGWLSASREFPQSVTLEFTEPQNLLGSRIYWEKDSSWYTYDLEVSKDGETWDKVIDSITVGGQHYKAETFQKLQKNVRFVRVTIRNVDAGGDFNIGMAEWILYGTQSQEKEFVYASDLEWDSAHADYGEVQKDQAAYGGKQVLHSKKGDLTFEKGLGTDTNSEIIYNVEDQGYSYFDAYIGINANASKQGGEAIFKIYKDQDLIYTSPVKMRDDVCEHVSVNIEGAKQVRLVTEWNNNPENPEARYNTHTNWSDAKFYYKDSARGELRRVYQLEESLARKAAEYTRATFQKYQEVMDQIPAILEDADAEDDYLREKAAELALAAENLRSLSELPPEELLEEILAQVEEVKKQAEEAMKAADAAKKEAQELRNQAEEMKNAAETAQEKAEEAQRQADAARIEAEKLAAQAGADSETAREAMKIAEEKAQVAEEARKEAEESKKAARTAEEAALAAWERAETEKKAAQAAREAAEAKAEAAEKAKEAAEAAKKEAEDKAEEAEKKAQEAQEAMRQAEERAKAAEEARKQAEEERKKAQELLEEMRLQREATERARDEAEKAKEEILLQKTKVAKGKLKSAKAVGKGKIKITWKKVKGASGYEISYSTNRKFKNEKVKKAGQKKNAVQISKLKGRKTYYVRVRAYKKVGDATKYGKYSKTVRVEVKK